MLEVTKTGFELCGQSVLAVCMAGAMLSGLDIKLHQVWMQAIRAMLLVHLQVSIISGLVKEVCLV